MSIVPVTPAELLKYLKDSKKAQSKNTQAILSILLSHSEGVYRCCLREELRQQRIDIGQPAAQIRDLRNAGVNIPKLKRKKCPIHNKTETIDRIDQPYITGNDYARARYTPSEMNAIKKILGEKDAYTSIRSTTNLEIDHRIPVARRRKTDQAVEDKVDISCPDAIREDYQLLTREMNLFKSRVCEACVKSETKPSVFLSIPIPSGIGGGKPFVQISNDCRNCPYAYPENFLSKVRYIEEPITDNDLEEW